MLRRRMLGIEVHSDEDGAAIVLIGLGCVIGLTAVIAIARAFRARSTLNENRMMRDYLRRIASDRSPDF
jgi:hypothetical protein